MPHEIIDIPARIRALPLDPVRKVPVPWFVAWINGKPEFRVADAEKRVRAVKEKRCWVCGDRLTRHMTFVAGPMCGINRTSAEPPCHTECARFSVRSCPFLSRPHMDRREGGLDELPTATDGEMIRRNPGVSVLWTVRGYSLFNDGRGGWLFDMGQPDSVEWWCEGRPATRAEVEESVRTGLPLLEAMARDQEGAMAELARRAKGLERLYPKAVV